MANTIERLLTPKFYNDDAQGSTPSSPEPRRPLSHPGKLIRDALRRGSQPAIPEVPADIEDGLAQIPDLLAGETPPDVTAIIDEFSNALSPKAPKNSNDTQHKAEKP